MYVNQLWPNNTVQSNTIKYRSITICCEINIFNVKKHLITTIYENRSWFSVHCRVNSPYMTINLLNNFYSETFEILIGQLVIDIFNFLLIICTTIVDKTLLQRSYKKPHVPREITHVCLYEIKQVLSTIKLKLINIFILGCISL